MHHHVSSLDVDEDGWTEIRNFMKCLLRMAISRNQSMVFFETVMSVRDQKHTYIEAVPIPNDIFAQVPAYFYSGLSEVESEWSDSDSESRVRLTPLVAHKHTIGAAQALRVGEETATTGMESMTTTSG